MTHNRHVVSADIFKYYEDYPIYSIRTKFNRAGSYEWETDFSVSYTEKEQRDLVVLKESNTIEKDVEAHCTFKVSDFFNACLPLNSRITLFLGRQPDSGRVRSVPSTFSSELHY